MKKKENFEIWESLKRKAAAWRFPMFAEMAERKIKEIQNALNTQRRRRPRGESGAICREGGQANEK